MHLLERQEQFEQLNRCFQEARRASGKLVFIAGEAGVGKSSLVERFVADHRRDARTLWGACDALSTPRALAPVYGKLHLSAKTIDHQVSSILEKLDVRTRTEAVAAAFGLGIVQSGS